MSWKCDGPASWRGHPRCGSGSSSPNKRGSRMTQDDVLFGYRLQLFNLAGRTTVANARPVFGVHRSTYYRVAFALGHPGLGPRRISARAARPEWGGLVVSGNGVWKALSSTGSTHAPSASRSSPATARPTSRPPMPSPSRTSTPRGRRAGRDRLLLRRPPARHRKRRLAADGDRHLLVVCLGRARALQVRCSQPGPDIAIRPQGRGRSAARGLPPRARALRQRQGVRQAGLHNNAERAFDRLQPGQVGSTADQRPRRAAAPDAARGMLATSVRPLPAGPLPRPPARATRVDRIYYNYQRAHPGRITKGRVPADLVYGAHKMDPR